MNNLYQNFPESSHLLTCKSFIWWGVGRFLEKAMTPYSSTLAWKIPWIEEPGRLQSMGSLRVGHDWEASLSRIGEGNGNPLQCSSLENPRDGGAWWAAISGVAQSRTRLKRLSSSSRKLSSVLCDDLEGWAWGRVGRRLTREAIYAYRQLSHIVG